MLKKKVKISDLSDNQLTVALRQLLEGLEAEKKIEITATCADGWTFAPEISAYWVRRRRNP
jgi:DMSO/TMAO reductase YedYZ molybdopterin-dependent catalytic subunit